MNHWVSPKAPRDVCTACGEKVDNQSDACDRVVLITGDCKGRPSIPLGNFGLARILCRRCADRAPYCGVSDVPDVEPVRRPFACESCRRIIGDDYVVVADPPAAAVLVKAFIDSIQALVRRAGKE